MKLTTKGRYAVTLLLDIALFEKQKPVTISEIAKRHGLSPAYLERIAAKLRQRKLLNSVRGAQGGYLLGRAAKDIDLAEVIQAVDENMDTTQCQGQANCHDGVVCLTHHLWSELNHVILNFLQSVTLQDLAQKPRVAKVAHEFYALPTPVLLDEK